MMQKKLTIPKNKTKLTKWFIFFALFAIFGVCAIVNPYLFIRSDNTRVIKLVGYFCILFFGFCGLFAGMRLFNRKPGMIIDDEGFIDYSSDTNIGKVLWKDIKQVEVKEIPGHKFIMVHVQNPLEYIEKEINPLKKQLLGFNFSLYQTPINISAKDLKIKFEELLRLIEGHLKKSGN